MISDSKLKGTILIVDDTPANIGVLAETLSHTEFKVLVANDGESAIAQLKYSRPDLILLDVMMPGISGFQTCEILKKNSDTKDIPVIFMTSLSDDAWNKRFSNLRDSKKEL
jgi:CheY-like chemotaxis protein